MTTRAPITPRGCLPACVAIALTCRAARAGRHPTAVTPTSVIKLFDGKSLANFDTWLVDHHESDPERVFSVVDQIDGAPAIRISGQFWGGLLTKQAYRDYRLIVEYPLGRRDVGRTQDADARQRRPHPRAGTARATRGKDFNGPWLRSLEFQIIEGGVGDFISVSGLRRVDGEQMRPSMTFRSPQGSRRRGRLRPKGRTEGGLVWPRELVGTQRGLGRVSLGFRGPGGCREPRTGMDPGSKR